jgi:hypothetical protein
MAVYSVGGAGLHRQLCAVSQIRPSLCKAKVPSLPPTSQEAKAKMAAAGIVPRAVVLVAPSSPPALESAVLRLMNNLAFDPQLRAHVVKAGLVQRLTEALQLGAGGGAGAAAAGSLSSQPLVWGLLYLASMEEGGREAIAAADILPRWVGVGFGSLHLNTRRGDVPRSPDAAPSS